MIVSGSGENLTFGGQFKTYKMTNGIELTLKYFPLYDNTTYNRQLHPVTLKPLESYRITFLDLGRRDNEANVVKVVRKDREFVNWCTAGSVTPAGYAHSNHLYNLFATLSHEELKLHPLYLIIPK